MRLPIPADAGAAPHPDRRRRTRSAQPAALSLLRLAGPGADATPAPAGHGKTRPRVAVRIAVAATAALLLAGCSATGADEPTRGADQQGYVGSGGALTRIAPDQRAPAPTLSGKQLGADDKTVSTADYAGKVVVLNVWGSWCTPCRQEAVGLQAASVATKADAQFVGINTRDFSEAAPAAFLRTQGVTYPSIFDPSGQTLLQLAGQVPPAAIPSTLVLDRQGRVAIRVLGQVSENTLTAMVGEVAAGR